MNIIEHNKTLRDIAHTRLMRNDPSYRKRNLKKNKLAARYNKSVDKAFFKRCLDYLEIPNKKNRLLRILATVKKARIDKLIVDCKIKSQGPVKSKRDNLKALVSDTRNLIKSERMNGVLSIKSGKDKIGSYYFLEIDYTAKTSPVNLTKLYFPTS